MSKSASSSPLRQRRTGIAALALLATACAAMPPAAAQDVPRRGPISLDRPATEFDPIGIPIRSFLLFPELRVGGGYDSNLFATPDNVIDDLFVQIQPALRLRSQWSRHELDLDLVGEFLRYREQTSEDRNDGRLQLAGRIDVSEELRLDADFILARETEGRGTITDDGTVDEPRRLDRLIGGLELTQDFDELRVSLAGEADIRDFELASDDARDRIEYRIEPRVSYAVSPRLALFATSEIEIARFNTVVGTDLDSISYGLEGGTTFDITGLLSGEIQIGVTQTNFEDASLSDQTNLTTSGEVTWTPTPLTTVRFGIDRSVIPTTVANAGSVVSTEGSIEAEHDLLRNLTLAFAARYNVADFDDQGTGGAFTDDTISLESGVTWRFNEWLGLELSHDFDLRESTDPTREFSRNQLFLRLIFQR